MTVGSSNCLYFENMDNVVTKKEVKKWVTEALNEYFGTTKKRLPEDRLLMDATVAYMGELGYPTTKSKVYKLSSSGQLPAIHINGKVMFFRKDIEQWVKKQLPDHCAIEAVTRTVNKKLAAAAPKIV